MTAQSIFRYVLVLSSTADLLEKLAMAVFAVAVLVYVIGRAFRRTA